MKTGQEEVEKIRCNACATFQPLYNFIERQLTGWREKGTVEQEAECARCNIRRRQDIGPEVCMECNHCKKRKHLRDFTSVAIRHWLQRDRHANVAVCYACHYPVCAMPGCTKTPEHVVAWNSWVSKDDFLRQACHAASVATEIFGDSKKRWFCGACKYPPCSLQVAEGCLRTRDAHRRQRFQQWTCQPCEQIKEMCSECGCPCLQTPSFQTQLAAP